MAVAVVSEPATLWESATEEMEQGEGRYTSAGGTQIRLQAG